MKIKNVKLANIFLRKKPVLALIQLLNNEEMYASNLAKSVDFTYSHLIKLLSQLEKLDIISFKREGRLKIIFLTKRGRELAKALESVVKVLT
ncbi:hypothetical protein J7L02_00795 [Candidatus Woesearchaeota archaeon]|nr:hypothetical protein [Candidatus Woesearchaeota archaeon]